MKDASSETIVERMLLVLNSKNDAAIAQAVGVTPQAVSEAKKKKIPPAWSITIAEKYQVSLDWLLFGRGTMRRNQEQTAQMLESGELVDETGAKMLFVPMVEARLSAGHGSLETSADVHGMYAFRAGFLRRRGNPAHMVMLRVTGDSMTPEIKNRDVVLIDQSQKDLRPGYIYAVGVEEMVYLKVVDAKPGQVILSSYNKGYEPLVIDMLDDSESRIRIIGRALWACRDLS
jgi:phage repressor protein C with HTH and peptisase S24 domain